MKQHQSGQALVALLFFVIIAMVISTTSVAVIVTNITSVTQTEHAHHALVIAEAGAENAIGQLLRNPSYSGETLLIDSGQVVIKVTGDTSKVIVSRGTHGQVQRTVQIGVTYSQGVMTITSWQEV